MTNHHYSDQMEIYRRLHSGMEDYIRKTFPDNEERQLALDSLDQCLFHVTLSQEHGEDRIKGAMVGRTPKWKRK